MLHTLFSTLLYGVGRGLGTQYSNLKTALWDPGSDQLKEHLDSEIRVGKVG